MSLFTVTTLHDYESVLYMSMTRKALDRIAVGIDKNDAREILRGACLYVGRKEIVSTDGKSLVVERIDVKVERGTAKSEADRLFIPEHVIRIWRDSDKQAQYSGGVVDARLGWGLRRKLKGEAPQDMKLEIGCSASSVGFKMTDMNYPKVHDSVARVFDKRMRIDTVVHRKGLLAAIKSLKPLLVKGFHIMTFHFRDGVVTITVPTRDQSGTVEVPCHGQAACQFEASFDHRRIVKLLNAHTADEIRLRMPWDNGPLVIDASPHVPEGSYSLVMPFILNSAAQQEEEDEYEQEEAPPPPPMAKAPMAKVIDATAEAPDDTEGFALWAAKQGWSCRIEIVGDWVWLRFRGKPSEAVRNAMKAAGCRWHRKRTQDEGVSVWYNSCGHYGGRGGRHDHGVRTVQAADTQEQEEATA